MNELFLGLIALAFVLQLLVPSFTEMFYFDPNLFLVQPYRIFTSMFLHGSFAHIFYNGLALLMFGTLLERRVGSMEYSKIFILGGIIGSLGYYLTVLLGIIPPLPALGASGAIYAVLGALSVLMPNLVIYVYFIPMRIREATILWVLLEFIGMFNPVSTVGHAAHLGGLIFGYLYGKHLLKKEMDLYYAPPPEMGYL